MISKRNVLVLLLIIKTTLLFAQTRNVTISGIVNDKTTKTALPYANVVLKTEKDSVFTTGTITDDAGRYVLTGIKTGNYILVISVIGYSNHTHPLFVGSLSDYLELPAIELTEDAKLLNEVTIIGKENTLSDNMEKKTFSTKDNISQSGGSVLQVMQNLPGVTVQDGKVQLRGNDQVAVLIDGKQSAMTGYNGQTGLDNIPASAIEKIEIINNPSAKYDANGNAGIINIIYKKNKQEGLNGKIGYTAGLGALWIRKNNLPAIRPQYQATPKYNPSLSLNYRKNKVNVFLQGDYLYTKTLNKNEFVTRTYDDGTIINQQTKRNRNTAFTTLKAGIDWDIDEANSLSVSGLFGTEKIIDNGDEPFYNADLSQRLRLWQFIEDELKTTITASVAYQHKFKEAGRKLNIGYSYTFHREDERYNFINILPTYTGTDAFKLLSDENVSDFNIDYIKPLRYGRFESGIKIRYRTIPTNMQFIPGENSPLDTNAGGWATYNEIIPAVYGNYIFENKKYEAELGLRVEYVGIQYDVNPNHQTYKSSGYNYTQPFPNMRLAYKIDDKNKISVFYSRRVDRPNEVDIRIFPKYDDAEIIKVGNPRLRPQFTNSIEAGYKRIWAKGYFYSALYHRIADGTITRIASTVPGSTLIYAIFQNAGKSYNTGIELVFSQDVAKWYSFNVNVNAYHNQIDGFSVVNLYPSENRFTSETQEIYSGNIKWNSIFHFAKGIDGQVTASYLAPDIIPQGKIADRFSIDAGLKKPVQKGKGEVFFNVTDLLNTLIIKKQIQGNGFHYTSTDYYETQVFRLGYSYKF